MTNEVFVVSRQDFQQIGRGFLMGGADIIPGVSGGTMALILNIYQRLVTAISRFDLTLLSLLKERKWKQAAEHVDFRFLFFLALGAGLGIGGLASLMHYLLMEQREPTSAAFFGLIAASSVLVARMIPRWHFAEGGLALVGAIIAFIVVGLPLLTHPPDSYLYLFGSGLIAICAMILPGISGAFILLILGKYTDITGMIKQFLKFDWSGDLFLSLIVFSVGCLCGLIGFSKLLKWLLERHESQMLAILCGLMIGSLRRIWPFKIDLTPQVHEFKLKKFVNTWPEDWTAATWMSIGIAVAAFVFVMVLDRVTHGHEHPTHAESQPEAVEAES
jgi:putative membrane protein